MKPENLKKAQDTLKHLKQTRRMLHKVRTQYPSQLQSSIPDLITVYFYPKRNPTTNERELRIALQEVLLDKETELCGRLKALGVDVPNED